MCPCPRTYNRKLELTGYRGRVRRHRRYLDLWAGISQVVVEEDAGLLVRSDVAKRQLDAEVPEPGGGPKGKDKPGIIDPGKPIPPGLSKQDKTKRYHGSVTLDPMRVGRDAGRIADEVIAHLTGLSEADVRVTLHIEADMPGGVAAHTERTVMENSRTLNFEDSGFEK